MIKTDLGIYIDPNKDIPFILNSTRFFVPLATKELLGQLYSYYLKTGNDKSIVLLKSGSILENLYLAIIDKKIIKEQAFSFRPTTILLWDEFINKEIKR